MFRRKSKEDKKDAVVLLEVAGKTIDMIFTFVKGQKIMVAKKWRPLPEKSYYLTSIKKVIDKLDLDKPVRVYIVDRDEPKNLEFKGIDVTTKEGIKYDSKTLDMLIDGNLFTAMMRALTVTKMQMLLYGSFGIVAYELIQGVLKVLIEVMN